MEDKDYTQALEGLIRNTEQNIINIREQIAALSPQEAPYSSDITKEFDAALAKAQGDYPQIGQNKENPYFKSGYATLDHIMVRIRPILARNGISLVQQRRYSKDGEMMLHTILKHSSGQWIESRSRVLPPKNDMQSLGSTLSYLKRYDAMALLGVTVSEDALDDDAEVTMSIARGPSNTTKQQIIKAITKEQLSQLEYELETAANKKELLDKIFDTFHIQSLNNLPQSKYQATITRIREIKEVEAGRKK